MNCSCLLRCSGAGDKTLDTVNTVRLEVMHTWYLKEGWLKNRQNQLYINYFLLQEEDHSFAPRLFQCSNASGTFRVEELQDFDQEVSTASCVISKNHCIARLSNFKTTNRQERPVLEH